MRFPAIPLEEEARLATVSEYDLVQPLFAATCEPLMHLARDLFGVGAAFLSLVERDKQRFVVCSGIHLRETSRETSFCAHTILRDEPLIVLDASIDPRFTGNPHVVGGPRIRFYAGIPLISPSGHAIGALCIADPSPRNGFTETAQRQLRDIAALVLDKLEVRRLDVARQAGQIRFETMAAASPDGIICADAHGLITFWNGAAERLFGHASGEAVGRPLDLIVPKRMRSGHDGGLHRVAMGGTPRLVGRTVELNALHRDGTEFPIELSLSMWTLAGVIGFGAILRNISERRRSEDQLFRLAHHDPLTGLSNRAVLRNRLDQLVYGTDTASVLVLDLDGFKDINDAMGHAAGDSVLRHVADRLVGCVRATDTVARLGGDEFAVVLVGVGDHRRASLVADAAIEAIAAPVTVDGLTLTIGASIGIATYPDDGSNHDDLLANADLALYQAKAEGRNCRRVFTPGLRRAAARARAQEQDLRIAYENDEFEVFYQPQVRLSDGALVGAEALLRWRHPERGLLSPADFLPALERSPFSAPVGEWVLGLACAQTAVWRRAGLAEFQTGVNLFSSQFRAGDIAYKVRAALAEAGLPGAGLELEITETIILSQSETMIQPFRELRDIGVGIAFDDYGTGYASLSMLKRCPITRLKIDRGFVGGMCAFAEDAAIVQAILYLGTSFGFDVIAEGVETEEQADKLRAFGCDAAQGDLYGPPMPATEFTERFWPRVHVSA